MLKTFEEVIERCEKLIEEAADSNIPVKSTMYQQIIQAVGNLSVQYLAYVDQQKDIEPKMMQNAARLIGHCESFLQERRRGDVYSV